MPPLPVHPAKCRGRCLASGTWKQIFFRKTVGIYASLEDTGNDNDSDWVVSSDVQPVTRKAALSGSHLWKVREQG